MKPETKEFGNWAVVFWKKGSKVLHIAQNQGEPNTTNYWMVGTTTKQFDYESGWLPNKEWTSTIKGHFSKEKAIQIAKENAMKENKGLQEGRLDHIKDKWQTELDKGVEPKILMDPWAVCEGMKWLGKDGWIRVEEVLIPTEYEEPYPDFYMEIFDQHTCKISHDIYTINEINSYVKETKARLVNNGIKNLTEAKLPRRYPNSWDVDMSGIKNIIQNFFEYDEPKITVSFTNTNLNRFIATIYDADFNKKLRLDVDLDQHNGYSEVMISTDAVKDWYWSSLSESELIEDLEDLFMQVRDKFPEVKV